MDEQLIARLFFVLLISTAVRGQNITNDQNETRLELTEIKLTWNGVKQSCDSLAGGSFFCNDTKCTPELADHFDTSNLPEVFTAWIDSYLVDSFTVTFIGCYEALKAHYFKEVRETEDFEMCVLACDSRYDFIGWMEKTCYCVMDVLVSTVSTSSHLLSINHCNGENRTGNGTVMNLHKRHEAYSLVTDYCPVAYYFGNVYFVSGIANCNQKKPFICNNSDIEFDEDTWRNAVKTCANMSSRLSYQPELKEVVKKQRENGAFWLQGSSVVKLTFDGYKAEQTRCTALEKDYSGRMEFIVLNCSSELPGLCVNQLKMIEETFSTTEDSLTEEDTTTDCDNINTTSVQTVDNESSPESTHSFLTDVMYPLTTNVIEKEPIDTVIEKEHNDNNDTGLLTITQKAQETNIGIAVGVVAVAICAIVFFVRYYRRKKKQSKERIIKRPKFKNYEVTSVSMLPQTLRYLPVSVAYPAEHWAKDFKVTQTKLDDAEGEQMETNATVHSKDDSDIGHENTLDREQHIVTGDLEECVVENNVFANYTYMSGLSVLHPGNLHESSTNASAPSVPLHDNDERSNTRSNVDKDDDQYINIPIQVPANLENTNNAEERYVSMAIVHDSIINDQVDRRSIEGQTNVTVDHTIKDQVDVSKKSGGTDSTTSTKNNREEVDIATLRELIHDDTIYSGVYVELSSDSNRGDRIDSAVFKLFDED